MTGKRGLQVVRNWEWGQQGVSSAPICLWVFIRISRSGSSGQTRRGVCGFMNNGEVETCPATASGPLEPTAHSLGSRRSPDVCPAVPPGPCPGPSSPLEASSLCPLGSPTTGLSGCSLLPPAGRKAEESRRFSGQCRAEGQIWEALDANLDCQAVSGFLLVSLTFPSASVLVTKETRQ